MVCLSQHQRFCQPAVCCTKCTAAEHLNSITAHFDSSVVLRRKQIFSVLCGLHKQAGASSGSNSGFVVRLSQWRHSEKFQMSASCLGWYNVTLCPIVHFVNTLQTPPFDIHWSPQYSVLTTPGLSDSPGGVNYWPGVTQRDSLKPGCGD